MIFDDINNAQIINNIIKSYKISTFFFVFDNLYFVRRHFLFTYIYIYMHIYIYICIYLEREREREKERGVEGGRFYQLKRCLTQGYVSEIPSK